MLRHSPLGFLLGTAIEVVVIVFLVSLLPRADLRPTNSDTSLAVSPVSWISDAKDDQPPVQQIPRRQAAPALIEAMPQRREFVEQQLDRSSQQLLNSVGSFVTQSRDQAVAKPVLPATAPTVEAAPASPNSQMSRPARGSFATQHRPWIRY